MKKSIIFTIILIIALLPSFAVISSAEYYNVHLDDMRSEAYLLVNLDTDTVVFAHNPDKRLQCSSLVKTATELVVIENCDDLDAEVTVTESAIDPLKWLYSASSNLQVGEKISVRNLLYCLIMENSNDAANVLAEYIGGSIDNFVKMMNDLAVKLGCKNTHFTNAHGLDDPEAYSTANDMYILTKKAMENSVLAEISGTVNYVVPATNMSEPRELNAWADILENGTRYYYEYVKNAKTGHTDEAKRCSAAVATKDAYSYVGIVMGCPNECIDDCAYPDNTALYEVRRMFRWAFGNMRLVTVAGTSDILTDIPVSLSSQADHVRLVPEKQIQALLLESVNSSSLEYVFNTEKDVAAPVEKGQLLGTVQIKYADSVIATANLVAGESVSRSQILYAGHLMKNIVSSPEFYISAAVIVAGILLYVFIIYSKHKQKQRETRKRLREIKEQNYASSADFSELSKK